MKAAVLREFNKDLQIEDIAVPKPGYGEVLVKTKASGLCGTDLHIQEGIIASIPLPHIPGHELAGEVYALGEGANTLKVGQHVIARIDYTCGRCRPCQLGLTNLCVSLKRIGFELDGSFEEYVVIKEENLFPISNKIPFKQAAIITDAVGSMYGAIKKKGQVKKGDKVLILGTGGLGIHGIQIAKHYGAQVYVTSRQDRKLELSKKFGADAVINTNRESLIDRVREITNGDMCDLVIDNIGLSSTIQDSINALRPGGRVVAVGYVEKSFSVIYQDLVIKEKEIVGRRGSTANDIREVIKLVESGAVIPYVFETYRLEDINQAFTDLREGKNLGRTVILFN